MMGLHIGAWSGLPIEAVFVWFAVTFTTVITYEVIKIWKALGTRALEAFFGISKYTCWRPVDTILKCKAVV